MKNDWKDLFSEISEPEASKRYSIVFTPRSGSTWLGDILVKSGFLGIPREWMNLQGARNVVLQSECSDIHQYYQHLKKKKRTGNVFGMEITWPQIEKLTREVGFGDILEDIQYLFYLRRKDYVAQGISLFKAANSGLFHSSQVDVEKKPVVYNGEGIAQGISRIMRQEFAFGQYLVQHARTPVPLWYEEITVLPPRELISSFAKSIELDIPVGDIDSAKVEPTLRKLGDDNSLDMAARFRDEFRDLVAFWDEYRGTKSRYL